MSLMLDMNAASGKVNQGNLSDQKEKCGLVSRNITISTHRTSVRLEPEMWVGLREICRREHVSIHDIATVVAVRKAEGSSMTAALRVFVMTYFRMAATEDGHNSAGHGPGGAYMRALTQKGIEEQDNRASGRNGYSFKAQPHA